MNHEYGWRKIMNRYKIGETFFLNNKNKIFQFLLEQKLAMIAAFCCILQHSFKMVVPELYSIIYTWHAALYSYVGPPIFSV